jgi:hypothetical protein
MDELEVIDQTTDTNLDLTTDQQTSDSADQSESTETQGQQAEEKIDGRRFNPEWSKALKELRELYPDRADMLTKLRDTYGRYGALTEIAPKGLEDVKAWKTTIDAVGGPEAAAELMQRAATMDQVDERIANADFTVISELPENLQKGFYQMLPDALSDLQTKDPQAFEAAVAPHFKAALAETGMGDHLKKMYTAAGDNEPLKELIKQQYEWFQQQTQGAGKMPGGQKTVSPEVQSLRDQVAANNKEKDDAFVSAVTESTNKYVSEAFTKEAAVYLKQLSLTDAQKSDLMESFNAKLVDKLGSDAAFQKQLAAYKSLKSRNPETISNYIRGKVDENAKAIIDGLVTARYGGMRQKTAPASTGTKTTDNGATRVAQAPDQSQWDMAKMEALGYEQTVKKGVFHLQGGRTVQLVRQ